MKKGSGKMRFAVALTHVEDFIIEADSEDEAIQKAYKEAEHDLFWCDVDVELLDEEE